VKEDYKSMSEVEAETKELKETVDSLTAERDAALAKVLEAEKVQRQAEAKEQIDKLVAEAKLPEPIATRLAEKFAGAESVEGVAETIDDQRKLIAELTEAGTVKGLGESQPAGTSTDREQLKQSQKQRYIAEGIDDAKAEQMADTFVNRR